MSDPSPNSPLAQLGASAPSQPPAAPPPAMEDSSTQALSEALRSSFRIVRFLMLVLVLVFLGSGVFVVEPNQVAVVLRFGKPVGVGPDQLLKPGYHWAWPYPIDEKVMIPVSQSHTVSSSSGWYAVSPDMEAQNLEPEPRGSLTPGTDGYVLTADGNIIHVRATIKYRILDPIRYTFGFANAPEILTNVINDAIIHAAARMTADAALYKDKTAYRDLVLSRVQQRIEDLGLGITLEPGDVETKAPADVRPAFEMVNTAEQERSKTVSNARGYLEEVTRKAVGEANAIVSAGLVSSNRLVSSVAAEARAFNEQLPSYRQNQELFRRRLLTSTMQRLLTNSNVKFTLPERVDELRLQLSREPEKRESGQPGH